MTSILPVNRLGAPTGALVVRDEDGNRVIPTAVDGGSVYTPPPTFDMDCLQTALPDDCTARVTAGQVNALASELLALMVEMTPDGSFSCDSVTNLATAFAVWRDALSFSASDISDASANGRSLITAANYAAMKSLLAIALSDVSGLVSALAAKEATASKGQANGYAPLDGLSKIASTYLPSYVDDVVEAADYAALPGTGEVGKIYVTLDTNLSYRWSGSAYVQIDHGDVSAVAGLNGNISASALKTALAIAAADITDASANGRALIAAANYVAMKALLAIGQSDVSGLTAALALLAPLANPTFTGTPAGPTASPGTNTTQFATTAFVAAAIGAIGSLPTGAIMDWPGSEVPASWLERDGSAISRSTYAALFAVMVKSATVTMTIATPCVVTWTAHGRKVNDPVKFTTTGALPTGLTAGTTYYVKTVVNANTFQIAATAGGAAINTSGTQSGVHTCIHAPHGDGDGSTTFNLPDDRGYFGRWLDTSGSVDANRSIGSPQTDSIKDHLHSTTTVAGTSGGSFTALAGGAGGGQTGGMTTAAGTETRPKNRAYLAIIKY